MISVTFPMRTVSEANRHTHWRERQRRAKGQRDATGLVVLSESQAKLGKHSFWMLPMKGSLMPELVKGWLVVTLTRISPRGLDDDNLRGALKAVRDGVADALGIDDRDPRVTWEYGQEKAKGYAVRIEIRRAA